jgi:lipoprotein-anchoring transpeptidase ErfK/SrfK
MVKINRREFLKYGAVTGASLIASDSFASSLFKKKDYHEDFSKSVKVILDDEPTLSISIGDTELEYPIVAGQEPDYPTPRGIFSVKEVIYKPKWYPPKNSDWIKKDKKLMEYLRSTDNIDENNNIFIPHGHSLHPLGDWKIRFYEDYYIHGAGDAAINKGRRYASHGCIRMRDENIGRVANFCKEYRPLIYIE